MPTQNPVSQTQANQQANQQQAQAYEKSALGQALANQGALPMDPAMGWAIAGAPKGNLMKGGPTFGSNRMSTGAPAGSAGMSGLNKALSNFDKGLT